MAACRSHDRIGIGDSSEDELALGLDVDYFFQIL